MEREAPLSSSSPETVAAISKAESSMYEEATSDEGYIENAVVICGFNLIGMVLVQ
jgi:hypothetical protein